MTAARCGFRGRLVFPDGSPAAGHKLKLLSLDPVLALGSVLDPEGATAEPGPAVAVTHSDARGGFLIEGLWPRSEHVLWAGIGHDHGRLQVIEQSPGPGEIVDLGEISQVSEQRRGTRLPSLL